jgi:acyl carrier protein
MHNKIYLILENIRPEINFKSTTNFISEGYLDSFDIVSLVSYLDEEFNISIDGTDIIPENFETIDSIYSLVTKFHK